MLTTFPEKQLSTSPTHSPIHTPKNTINNNKHSTLSSTSPSPKKSKPSIEIVMTDLKPNAPPVLTPPDRKPPSFVQVISNEVAPPPIDSVYLPPHKRYLLNTSLTPAQNSPEYQLRLWTALKGSIISCLNKADATNVPPLVVDLFRENLLWGRGLLCRALMRSESAAPTLAPVLAAIVAVINTKLPQVGELLVRRLVAQFQRAYRRHDKVAMTAAVTFLAHLTNQLVVHELTALELLALLLERPTDDSVDVAIEFVKQCGARLEELTRKGLLAVFEAFRAIASEGRVGRRVQYSVEDLYAVYRDRFAEYPAVAKSLDLVEDEDTIVHMISIRDKVDTEDILDVFTPMEESAFFEMEKMYNELKAEILAESSSEAEDAAEAEDTTDLVATADTAPDKGAVEDKNRVLIRDMTSAQLVALRQNIYLTIASSLSFEEAVHKLLKIKTRDGDEPLVAEMVLDCCTNERAFRRDLALTAERLCKLSRAYAGAFDDLFGKTYAAAHRLETGRLRNAAAFFAHLVASAAVSWDVLEYVRITEADTTSSSRIFLKVFFQDLASLLGASGLREKLWAPELAEQLAGVFPREKARDVRFAVNFFTAIGLGSLSLQLREHLETMMAKEQAKEMAMLQLSSDEEEQTTSSSSSSDGSEEAEEGDGDESSDSGSGTSTTSSSETTASSAEELVGQPPGEEASEFSA